MAQAGVERESLVLGRACPKQVPSRGRATAVPRLSNRLLLRFQETASCGSCPEDDAVQNPKALVSWATRQAGSPFVLRA